MKSISLTNSDLLVKVSDCDFARVSKHKWFWKKTKSGSFYAARSQREGKKIKTIWMHRFITSCSAGLTVDHLNKDRLDNTRENLECITNLENVRREHNQ